MKHVITSALLSLMVLLSGCVAQTISTEAAAKIKTVGIISAVGDELNMQAVAIIAFGNEQHKVPIADWGLDKHIVELIANRLRDRYTIVPVSYQAADFDTDRIGDPRLSNGLAEAIRTKVTPPNLDAYLVVLKDTVGMVNTNQVVNGLGVARRATFAGHFNWVHAIYEITIVDGHSLKTLATLDAASDTNSSVFASGGVFGPYRDADDSYWSDEGQAFSDAQRAKILASLTQLLDATVPPTIQGLKLLP